MQPCDTLVYSQAALKHPIEVRSLELKLNSFLVNPPLTEACLSFRFVLEVFGALPISTKKVEENVPGKDRVWKYKNCISTLPSN